MSSPSNTTDNRPPLGKEATWWLSGRLSENEPIRQVCMDRMPFRVGRDNGLELSIPCPTISSKHAEFDLNDNRLRIRDSGSTNGTFVNGIKIPDCCVLNDGDLVQFAEVVFRVYERSAVTEIGTMCGDGADRALSLIQFDQLMAERAVLPFFQPIVSLDDRRHLGYEVLSRSRFYGLAEPKAMFHAAALLGAEAELSRLMREEGISAGSGLASGCPLFVNTHPTELQDTEVLLFSLRELRENHPIRPIVLEIHEASMTNPVDMRELKARLADIGIGLAYDDFGAGQARLAELIEVPPDYLKFDLKLIQGIDTAGPQQQSALKSLISMVHAIGVVPVAEGIETAEVDQTCRRLGFEVGQGFFYGRPAPAKQYVQNA